MVSLKKNKANIRILIIFYISFSLFTLFLFDFGPTKYEVNNSFQLHVLIYSYIFSYVLGLASFKGKVQENSNEIQRYNDQKMLKRLNKGIYINLILYVIFAINSNGCRTISAFLFRIVNGIKNPSLLYYDKILDNLSSNQFISLLSYLLYPYMLYILLGSIYNFKKIKLTSKFIVVFTVIIELLKWFGVGTNKGIFDILILAISLFLIYRIKSDSYSEEKTRIKLKYKLIIIIGFMLCFGLFNYFISSRLNETNLSFNSSMYNGYKHFSGYLTNGYKGMDYTLSLNWEPTFGFGSSMFLSTQMDKYIKTNIFEHTYQKRAEIFGWSATVKWHTMYSWFANDFSYIGVILVMFLLGRLTSRNINDFIFNHDYRSLVLFYLMIMMIFYSSANNQVFSVVTSLIAFWFFFLSKIIFRRRG